MNNNRKAYISWTFIYLLFPSSPSLSAYSWTLSSQLFMFLCLSFAHKLEDVTNMWSARCCVFGKKATQILLKKRDFGKIFEKTFKYLVEQFLGWKLESSRWHKPSSCSWWRSSERSSMIHWQAGSGQAEWRVEDLYGELSAFEHLYFKSSISPHR